MEDEQEEESAICERCKREVYESEIFQTNEGNFCEDCCDDIEQEEYDERYDEEEYDEE